MSWSWRFTSPSKIRTKTMTPAWFEYWKSKTRARRLFSPGCSIFGGGIRFTISASKSATPSPVFPETSMTVSGSTSRSDATSMRTSSTRESGESTLERTGIITSPASRAIWRTERVCACTPCVESTRRIEPSTARIARDTSYEKSMCPGVSMRLSLNFSPAC